MPLAKSEPPESEPQAIDTSRNYTVNEKKVPPSLWFVTALEIIKIKRLTFLRNFTWEAYSRNTACELLCMVIKPLNFHVIRNWIFTWCMQTVLFFMT